MTQTLDYLKDIAREHADTTVLQEDDVQVSYTELAVAVNALAVALQMKDPTPASRVALCAENSISYLLSVLAIQAAGKILMPMDPKASPDTLHALLETGMPTVLIADETGHAKIRSDDDFKILFSQFEGLVRTYRDHTLPCQL